MINNQPTSANIYKALLAEESTWVGCVETALAIRRYGASVGSLVMCHKELSRAMDRARQFVAEVESAGRSVPSGAIIFADQMTGSKGRFTRTWHAPTGGVWGCLLHANTLLPKSRQFVSLAVGVACCETVREFGVEDASLRWVNDVLVAGKKIAGFLVEGYHSSYSGEEYNLIGFGVNINNGSFPPEIQSSAVSLADLLGKPVSLSAFSEKFIAKLAWNMGLLYYEEEQFLEYGHFSGHGDKHLLLQRFLELSETLGKRVIYGFDVMTAPEYEADVIDINNDGGLVLRLDDGYIKTEYSGEIRYI